ncbi:MULTISPECIES: DMT family transporter [Pseudomonas]|jgi:transporter family-2 protein|uniref:EamA-like transporter family protein n=1 Tax=Pseudomonas proteolytica TaxID=219574 RepID=A0AAP6YGV3_9PSED|nr:MULTISPECIES: DMT family transporter [Pseudomonas]KAA8694469.1 DMT family transporter [Pseudomonas proteolytica]MBC3339262.1 DMT family transporter [Pseudomonas proteolytica]MCF5059015.1 EamA-like transporter family protein [Pseudomonas proteolytica]MCF5102899.1 EamA-like transporter family protein [Pseudomonas proteolytica]MDF3161558.1 DMT family transporter [Pseudomonas proteolytica]
MTTLHWLGLLLLAVIAGAVVPFQSAINANLGRGLGHPLWATLASLLVSILVLLPVILALRLPLPSLGFISKAPLWMWTGGAFGVCFISLALVLLPKLGASGFIALALSGQVLASLLLDHFGLFGLVERQLTAPRLLGVLMLIGGVALIQFSAAPTRALTAVG